MRRSWKTVTISAVLMCALWLGFTESAHAAWNAGYVCSTRHVPTEWGSMYGNYGYVYVSLYTEPGCQGSYITYADFLSTGANLPSCNSASYERYREAGILHLARSLHLAAVHDQYVALNVNTSICGHSVTFYSGSYHP